MFCERRFHPVRTAIKRQVPVSDMLAVVRQCEGGGVRRAATREGWAEIAASAMVCDGTGGAFAAGFVPLAGVESIVLSEPVEAEAIAAFASSYEARVVAASEGALGSADGSHGRQGNVLPDGPDLRAPAAPSEAALSCSFPDGSDR
jgi:hypothetical protein